MVHRVVGYWVISFEGVSVNFLNVYVPYSWEC